MRASDPGVDAAGPSPDPAVIRIIVRRNRVTIEGVGRVVCLGAYGHVVQGGVVHMGDMVRLGLSRTHI